MYFTSRFSYKFKFCQLFIVLLLGFADSAFAQSIDRYCISRVKPEVETIPKIPWQADVFSINGKEYLLEESVGIGEIHIKERISGKLISKVRTNFREKDEWITHIEISKGNIVFIWANKNNYVTKILEEPEIKLGHVHTYPKIDKEKCGFWNRFFDTCFASSFDYSPTLDRLFISGYRERAGKHKWETIESLLGDSYYSAKTLPFSKSIKSFAGDSPSLNGVFFKGVDKNVVFYDGSKTIQLPKQIKEFIRDVPSLNGVVLQGKKNEMFFYNGQNITKLNREIEYFVRELPFLKGILFMGTKAEVFFYDGNEITEIFDFIKNAQFRSWKVIEPIVFNQPPSEISNERIFITNFSIGNKPLIFFELTDKLFTKPISFPNNTNISPSRLFRFSNDSLIWTMIGNNILVESNANFQSVVTVPKGYRLTRNPYATSVFQFEVEKGSGKQLKIATYYITQASPAANCKKMLDPNKTIMLQPEFKN